MCFPLSLQAGHRDLTDIPDLFQLQDRKKKLTIWSTLGILHTTFFYRIAGIVVALVERLSCFRGDRRIISANKGIR
jgi:hypothetical protein